MVESATTLSTSPVDENLCCLQCDYNLTGLTGPRCPECGMQIDWNLVRDARDQEVSLPSTPWDSWSLYCKPLAFLATAGKVALRPWSFAKKLHARLRIGWALSFLALCFAFLLAGMYFLRYDIEVVMGWSAGVACHFLLQCSLLGLILRTEHLKHPFRFWLAVSCYSSYPLVIEVLAGGPPFFYYVGNQIRPFTLLPAAIAGPVFCPSSILYYLWWFDLLLIAAVRLGRKRWWRVVLAMIVISFITFLSLVTGFFVGVLFFKM